MRVTRGAWLPAPRDGQNGRARASRRARGGGEESLSRTPLFAAAAAALATLLLRRRRHWETRGGGRDVGVAAHLEELPGPARWKGRSGRARGARERDVSRACLLSPAGGGPVEERGL